MNIIKECTKNEAFNFIREYLESIIGVYENDEPILYRKDNGQLALYDWERKKEYPYHVKVIFHDDSFGYLKINGK